MKGRMKFTPPPPYPGSQAENFFKIGGGWHGSCREHKACQVNSLGNSPRETP